MSKLRYVFTMTTVCLLGSYLGFSQKTNNPPMPMSFFITSAGPGDGGNLGGLPGADAHCQKLAAAVGAGNKTWHGYLHTQTSGNQPAVNARDRIGQGPWYNAKGVRVADSVADFNGDTLETAGVGAKINNM